MGCKEKNGKESSEYGVSEPVSVWLYCRVGAAGTWYSSQQQGVFVERSEGETGRKSDLFFALYGQWDKAE